MVAPLSAFGGSAIPRLWKEKEEPPHHVTKAWCGQKGAKGKGSGNPAAQDWSMGGRLALLWSADLK